MNFGMHEEYSELSLAGLEHIVCLVRTRCVGWTKKEFAAAKSGIQNQNSY